MNSRPYLWMKASPMTATAEIILKFPHLHNAQRVIRDSTARYRVLACGRRFGKTTLITDIAGELLVMGKRVAYYNPSYAQGKEVWEDFKDLLRPVIARKDETTRRLEIIGGGVLKMWSLDSESTAETSLGNSYHAVFVDEAARVPNLMKVWNKTISPMLMDYKGSAFFVSTPKGLNDFYSLYQRGLDPLYPDWQSFHYPTAANPYIHFSEIEKARLEKPELEFREEILAEFIADGAGVFRGVSDAATLSPVAPYAGRFVFGIDWAQSSDYTVVSVIDLNTRKQVALDRFNQLGWQIQRDRVVTLYEAWKPERIIAEHNSIGGPNIEALYQEGLPMQPFTTTAQSKATLIQQLALMIERKQIALLDDPIQRGELHAYAMERGSTGLPRYSAPTGQHDDTVMALALACYGVANAVPDRW